MAKSLGCTANEEELRELEVFLESYPKYKKVQQVTKALSSGSQRQGSLLTENEVQKKLDKLWVKINKAGNTTTNTVFTDVKTVPFNLGRWVAAAAVFLVAATGLLWYVNQAKDQTIIALNHVTVPFGKTAKFTLPDGTKIILNAGSHFTYPKEFAAKQREVSLDGEGFFEVTKNARKPFLVHTAGLTVKVLGTVFNLKAFTGDKKIETTLLQGKVQVDLTGEPEKEIILLPREKLTVVNDRTPAKQLKTGIKEAVKIKYQVASIPNIVSGQYQENAWINNEIIFTNQDFDEVAKQMERRYDVRFVFEDEGLKTEQISGVLKSESLDDALKILKMTTPFKSKIEGKTVYVSYISKHQ